MIQDSFAMNRTFSAFIGFEVPYFFFAVKAEELKLNEGGRYNARQLCYENSKLYSLPPIAIMGLKTRFMQADSPLTHSEFAVSLKMVSIETICVI